MSDEAAPLDPRAFARELGIAPLNYAYTRAIRMGLPIPESSMIREIIPFPEDLSTLTPLELSQQLGQWSALCAYTWTLHGTAIVARDHAASAAKLIYDQQLARAAGIGVEKVAAQKARASANDEVVKAQAHLAKSEALVELLTRLGAGYDRFYQAISRQITVMEAEMRRSGSNT